MRRSVVVALFFCALLVVGAPLSLAQAPTSEEVERATREVIESQLDAFRRDDWAAAFVFASPGIQAQFRTPENFGVMVQRGYPMVWRPAEVAFLGARQEGALVEQKIRFVDRAGEAHFLCYYLALFGAGADAAWRIQGVARCAPDPLA